MDGSPVSQRFASMVVVHIAECGAAMGGFFLKAGTSPVSYFRELTLTVVDEKRISLEEFRSNLCFVHFGVNVAVGDEYIFVRIIVEIDDYCKATDSWYYGNQTQPKLNQPWYHVLVHGSDQVTYAAESNLLQDGSSEAIDHPLISYFFNESEDGYYNRNENPWPETDY